MQGKLLGKERKRFNTACIVVDTSIGKVSYGRNHGIESDGSKKKTVLFGDSTREGILPKKSLNRYPIGNMAAAIPTTRSLCHASCSAFLSR